LVTPWSVISTGNETCVDEQLDIQVGSAEGAQYLEKYDLKANDAILAEEKHMPIYDDIVANAKVDYVAGGAAQNAARAAAVGSSHDP